MQQTKWERIATSQKQDCLLQEVCMVRFLECSYSHSLSLHPGTSMLILKMKSLAVSTRNSSQQGGQELCLFIGTRWTLNLLKPLTQSHFSPSGLGETIFNFKFKFQDWVSPYSCKLVNYQTAHSALVEVTENIIFFRLSCKNVSNINHTNIYHTKMCQISIIHIFIIQNVSCKYLSYKYLSNCGMQISTIRKGKQIYKPALLLGRIH